MAANRKLQGEIQQVLKKIEEGVEIFDETIAKVYAAETQTLKEKFEADLKKEIKKLQRLRDQIKTWIGSNEIKDKGQLTDAKRLIETKMELFKVCEKDTKTKAYSKEGLAREAKLDPKEALKEEKRQWLNDCLEQLQDFINTVEAEKEKAANAKGNKKSSKDAIEKFDNRIQKNKWHMQKIELILRLLDGEDLDPTSLDNIKDSLEYYLETAADDDGAISVEHEFDIYEDLNLEALQEANTRALSLEYSPRPHGAGEGEGDEKSPTAEKETHPELPAAAAAPAPSPAGIPKDKVGSHPPAAPAATTAHKDLHHKEKDAHKDHHPEPAHPPVKTVPIPPPINKQQTLPGGKPITAASIVAGGSSTQGDKPSGPQLTAAQILQQKQPQQNAASAASPVQQQQQQQPPTQTLKSVLAPSHTSSPAVHGHSNVVSPVPSSVTPLQSNTPASSQQQQLQQPATTASHLVDEMEKMQINRGTSLPPSQLQQQQQYMSQQPSLAQAAAAMQPNLSSPQAVPLQSPQMLSQQQQMLKGGPSPTKLPQSSSSLPEMPSMNRNDSGMKQGDVISPPPISLGGILGTPSLAGLTGVGGGGSGVSAPSTPQGLTPEMMNTLAMLKHSATFMPEVDTEKSSSYVPRNYYNTHPLFPSQPLFSNAEGPQLFDKLSWDTYFFSFYFQQGSYQQYLAAKKLKKASWRFHKKYTTWFQRHNEPKIATKDYEEGTYLYFDYESGWCNRIKTEFKFEYAFLEDEVNIN
jgi:CCR4-NOT transcription complex subunit 3